MEVKKTAQLNFCGRLAEVSFIQHNLPNWLQEKQDWKHELSEVRWNSKGDIHSTSRAMTSAG
jgi:hypothetical protein